MNGKNMVEIKLRNNNNIITLLVPGKIPLQSSQGLNHFSANELLCSSIGSCVGRTLVIHCAQNSINIKILETILVSMNNNCITILIKYANDIDKDIITSIEKKVKSCELVTSLSKSFDIEVEMIRSEFDKKKLQKQNTKKCCGE